MTNTPLIYRLYVIESQSISSLIHFYTKLYILYEQNYYFKLENEPA